MNAAVAAARLGTPTALLTRISDDGFGDLLRAHLAGAGVDLRSPSRAPNPPAWRSSRSTPRGAPPTASTGRRPPTSATTRARAPRCRPRWSSGTSRCRCCARPARDAFRDIVAASGRGGGRGARQTARSPGSSTPTRGPRCGPTPTPSDARSTPGRRWPTWSRPATRTSPRSAPTARRPTRPRRDVARRGRRRGDRDARPGGARLHRAGPRPPRGGGAARSRSSTPSAPATPSPPPSRPAWSTLPTPGPRRRGVDGAAATRGGGVVDHLHAGRRRPADGRRAGGGQDG
jgi:hypothetical protein